MVSLKPPWKQKNPAMEKACQAYHRNTAPEKAIEVLKKLKIVDPVWDITFEKEVEYNGSSGGVKRTQVLFIRKEKAPREKETPNDPEATASINTKNGELLSIEVGKLAGHDLDVYFEGKKLGTVTGYRGFTF